MSADSQGCLYLRDISSVRAQLPVWDRNTGGPQGLGTSNSQGMVLGVSERVCPVSLSSVGPCLCCAFCYGGHVRPGSFSKELHIPVGDPCKEFPCGEFPIAGIPLENFLYQKLLWIIIRSSSGECPISGVPLEKNFL